MIKTIALVVLVAIAGFLVYANTLPNTFHVERSISIKAPPEEILPHIGDLHAWQAWSPYFKLDPNMKYTYSGTNAGIGAVYEWQGNGRVGAGRMTIVDVAPPKRVVIRVDRFKPLIAHNEMTFTLQPEGAGTEVTWAMEGRNNIFAKVARVFVNQDAKIGKRFARGLANLKEVMENPSQVKQGQVKQG